jgi:hypothetical protein
MADPMTTTTKLLSGASPEIRRSLISGMRWTLWPSMLSIPLGYATTVIPCPYRPGSDRGIRSLDGLYQRGRLSHISLSSSFQNYLGSNN